jgi:hypothetical protein
MDLCFRARQPLAWTKLLDLAKFGILAGVVQIADHQGWKCLSVSVTDKDSGTVIEYKIHFYRKINGWYDEVRYDSHEIKRGRKTLAPHLHIKLGTPFKDSTEGEVELKQIIDGILPKIKEITE